MTVLSDRTIRERLDNGIVIRPMADGALQPASCDVRLGRTLKIPGVQGVRIHDLIEDGPYWLGQFTFMLAATLEWIEVPTDLAARLEGKSTRARQGLILENAGYVDPGWRGELTLELFMLSPRPLVLEHGMAIGQIRFETLTEECERPYGSTGLNSHYQGSAGPVEPRTGGMS